MKRNVVFVFHKCFTVSYHSHRLHYVRASVTATEWHPSRCQSNPSRVNPQGASALKTSRVNARKALLRGEDGGDGGVGLRGSR